MKRFAAAGLILLSLLFAVHTVAESTTVILVRHAEKAADGSTDPDLTDEGRARAERLAAILSEVHLDAVYSTPFKRTKGTASPVAAMKGLEVTITEVGPDFAQRLAEKVLEENRGKTVLIVGHSNTLGPTIAALGGGTSFEIDEKIYGDLFVCVLPADGEPTLLQL